MTVMTGQEISKENGLSTWKLLGLTIITGGVFFIYWMKKMTELVEAFSGERVWKNSTFIVFLFLIFGVAPFLGAFLGALGVTPGSVSFFSDFLWVLWFVSVVALCMVIQWPFKARKIMRLYAVTKLEMPKYKMNAFYTFIFNCFYINYCLNDLGYDELLQHGQHEQHGQQTKTLTS